MATVKGLKKKINEAIWKLRRSINKRLCSDIAGEKSGVSIISCNCTGGLVMSELNIKFMSPTVNLYMSTPDFIELCENFDEYINSGLIDASMELQYHYPVLLLGNKLVIHAVHYRNSEDFIWKWNERKKRIHKDKLFLIFVEQNGFMMDMLPRIAALQYDKVMFAKQKYAGYDFICVIPGFENNEYVGDISSFIGLTGKRLYSRYNFAKQFRKMMNEKRYAS